ncbi:MULTISPECIES: hypothetical protein [Brevundimonas]|uniref:hypothetical protein n=1 Tax=Brevundimonas pishanensis TaxID=2896315 RepID=UPI001FA72C91|nr:hypothetical protein [Brevundimonas pishanensis]
MTRDVTGDDLSELLLDAEIWDAPDRLSADECLDEIGADWRQTRPRKSRFEEEM